MLSGYKDLALFSDKKRFPAILQGIILGPNMKNSEINKYQLETIAEENGIKMPTFFGYMLWSIGCLVPVFLVDMLIFFM